MSEGRVYTSVDFGPVADLAQEQRRREALIRRYDEIVAAARAPYVCKVPNCRFCPGYVAPEEA